MYIDVGNGGCVKGGDNTKNEDGSEVYCTFSKWRSSVVGMEGVYMKSLYKEVNGNSVIEEYSSDMQ